MVIRKARSEKSQTAEEIEERIERLKKTSKKLDIMGNPETKEMQKVKADLMDKCKAGEISECLAWTAYCELLAFWNTPADTVDFSDLVTAFAKRVPCTKDGKGEAVYKDIDGEKVSVAQMLAAYLRAETETIRKMAESRGISVYEMHLKIFGPSIDETMDEPGEKPAILLNPYASEYATGEAESNDIEMCKAYANIFYPRFNKYSFMHIPGAGLYMVSNSEQFSFVTETMAKMATNMGPQEGKSRINKNKRVSIGGMKIDGEECAAITKQDSRNKKKYERIIINTNYYLPGNAKNSQGKAGATVRYTYYLTNIMYKEAAPDRLTVFIPYSQLVNDGLYKTLHSAQAHAYECMKAAMLNMHFETGYKKNGKFIDTGVYEPITTVKKIRGGISVTFNASMYEYQNNLKNEVKAIPPYTWKVDDRAMFLVLFVCTQLRTNVEKVITSGGKWKVSCMAAINYMGLPIDGEDGQRRFAPYVKSPLIKAIKAIEKEESKADSKYIKLSLMQSDDTDPIQWANHSYIQIEAKGPLLDNLKQLHGHIQEYTEKVDAKKARKELKDRRQLEKLKEKQG